MQCLYCNSGKTYKFGFTRGVESRSGECRQRYRCSCCLGTFSENAHLFDFRHKKSNRALSSLIFSGFVHGMSNRQIARYHGISECCVRQRLDRMAKQAFIFHSKQVEGIMIKESVAFDGLENFSGSQYDPNNINQAIGAESLFIYDFNFTPLNRKGRQSPWQKKRLSDIEKTFGRYDPRGIRHASACIFERLCVSSPGKLELFSDEHFQYRRAISARKQLRNQIIHKTVSSKACRNFQNILFSVNHTDLLIRQRIAAFSRETISFAKTAGRMIQKYMLFLVYKNYMATQFTKKHVRRPEAHEKSPAQMLGLTKQLLRFSQVFKFYPRQAEIEGLSRPEWRQFAQAELPDFCKRSLKFKRRKKAA